MSEVEAWKDLFRVEVKELLGIGSDDLNQGPYVFSGINDLHFDAVDNIYILDRRDFQIKVFSPTGYYLRAYRLSKGQGPGEFQRPLCFDIGPDGDLFIADMTSRRIVELDRQGRLITTMSVRGFPGEIAVGPHGEIFSTNGLVRPDEFELRSLHYPEGTLVRAFCPANDLSKWIGQVGGNGNLCVAENGNVLYAFTIPYDIREFTPAGELVRRFGRKIPGWTPPPITHVGLPDSAVSVSDIDTFPDGKVLVSDLDRRTKTPVFGFDIFDRAGTWLASFDTTQHIKDKSGRMARIDGQGHVYMEFWEPFPHLRKYQIEYVSVRDGGIGHLPPATLNMR